MLDAITLKAMLKVWLIVGVITLLGLAVRDCIKAVETELDRDAARNPMQLTIANENLAKTMESLGYEQLGLCTGTYYSGLMICNAKNPNQWTEEFLCPIEEGQLCQLSTRRSQY